MCQIFNFPNKGTIKSTTKGKKHFIQHVTELSKAFALSVPHPEADRIRDELAYFQAVRAVLEKVYRKPAK
jgi:type I restriction enzyme R subunit